MKKIWSCREKLLNKLGSNEVWELRLDAKKSDVVAGFVQLFPNGSTCYWFNPGEVGKPGPYYGGRCDQASRARLEAMAIVCEEIAHRQDPQVLASRLLSGAPEHLIASQAKEFATLNDEELCTLSSIDKLPLTPSELEKVKVIKGGEILSRLEKRFAIANTIANNVANGAYETIEHLTSSIDVWKDKPKRPLIPDNPPEKNYTCPGCNKPVIGKRVGESCTYIIEHVQKNECKYKGPIR